ncbi:hypothetical protein CANINC_002015 [Pichia inconspicua]|uniref:Major facilitator superfamily (MFS) profile domain-containing protein n=1 Tax=Pichia inconspicua TaxID=52247 RepID=A0A4T0X280_9ASCO|nr:hypothetical protein CANINC_002015 [[Candida] inconspicua]
MRPDSSTPLVDTGKVSSWTLPLLINVGICCLASVQYGYHMAELNAPAKLIRQALQLSQSQLGLITAIFSIGGLVSSTFASYISTRKGLKVSFLCTCMFYILGSLIESRAYSYITMLIGRFISGLGAGLAIVYVPVYVNDIAPIDLRGILGSMTQISVNLGILLTQVLAIFWNGTEDWRKILHFGWIVGLINIAGVYLLLMESPKWLIIRSEQKNERLGIEVLTKLRNSDDVIEEVEIWKSENQLHLTLIENNPHLKQLGFWYYLTDKNYYNSRTIATFMMFGQQFAGINSVIFYGVDIISKVFPKHSILTNVLISLGNTIITGLSSLFLDRAGRKPLLILSLLAMTISLLILSMGVLNDSTLLTVTSIFTYVGSFAIGCGPIPFLIIGEVSQSEVKDVAQSWATDCNWISVFIVGTMFPILNNLIGGWVYLIFASVCLTFAAFVYYFVPETKGCRTYEEVWGTRLD